MQSSQFQALIKTLKGGYISKFITLVDKFTENKPSRLPDSENYDKFRTSLEGAYYGALSHHIASGEFNKFIQLFNYSDKLGIFIDVSNIDVAGIITKLHIEGLNNGDRGRIVELVSFFNKYNLFERNFTSEELNTIQEIKENYPLIVINLKDLFGNVSDSLIYYVCKMMPHDYVVWLSENYNMLGENYSEDFPARVFVTNPNFLRNWTDNFSIYGLIVRNLGKVEDFIKAVETMQNSENLKEGILYLEFNPRYIISVNEDRIIREFREVHIIHPENVLQNKEKILNKNNYTFFSLSMVIFGGLGPEGFGFTYSTPKGEVIEICSDQRETEAIIIQFKQYLKRKFLDKLEKEMDSLNIDFNIKGKIINYLSEVIKPKDLVSYYDKNSILRKIRNLLVQYDEFQNINESEIEEILQKISSAISMIFKDVKLEDQFRARMDLVANGKLKSEDIAKLTSLRGKSHFDVLRERIFLQNKPYWFFKDYSKEIKELEKKYNKIVERVRMRRNMRSLD